MGPCNNYVKFLAFRDLLNYTVPLRLSQTTTLSKVPLWRAVLSRLPFKHMSK